MIIIITGKTGVGKTTLLQKTNLKNIIYADNYVKENFYIKGHPLFDVVIEHFGDVTKNNKIDTSKLGKIVLQDEKKMEELNNLVVPFVQEWIKSIRENVVIEMASYINNEKSFKSLVDKVILIERDKWDLSNKFTYLDKKIQPIKDKKIKIDFIIENNSTVDEAAELLRETIENLLSK